MNRILLCVALIGVGCKARTPEQEIIDRYQQLEVHLGWYDDWAKESAAKELAELHLEPGPAAREYRIALANWRHFMRTKFKDEYDEYEALQAKIQGDPRLRAELERRLP